MQSQKAGRNFKKPKNLYYIYHQNENPNLMSPHILNTNKPLSPQRCTLSQYMSPQKFHLNNLSPQEIYMNPLSPQEFHLDNLSLQEVYVNPLSPQEYCLKTLSRQNENAQKKSPLINPEKSKTPQSLKGNCKENNLLNEVISWFGDQKSVAICRSF